MNSIKDYTLTFLLTLLFFGQGVQASQKLVLGVYQYQTKDAVMEQYQDFANYLSNALPNHDIDLQVYSQKELLNAIQKNQVHLLLISPSLYEVVRSKITINGITATQQVDYDGHLLDQLGGVIFTQKNNKKVQKITDLVGQKIAIPSRNNTGAYRIPLYELYKADIDYKSLDFIEVGDNDSVVKSVLSGKADVGFVRTGIIEKWHTSHKLNLDDIRVINAQNPSKFPQLLSTELYPEWPFIILPGLDENLNRDISVALFALRSDNPAAKQAGIAGFVAPRDYLPFENVLRTLKVAPFNKKTEITLIDLWQQYKMAITLFVFLLLSIILLLILSEKRKHVISLQEQRLKKQTRIDEVLLDLPKHAESFDENQLLQYALDKLEKLSASPISFIHAVDEEKGLIKLLTWSHNTLENHCQLENYEWQYSLENSGVWAEAARTKHPVLINDYKNYQPKKGMPKGHLELKRMISLPVIDHDKVVLIAGVGNKPENYTQEDINTFQLIVNDVWRIIKENRANRQVIEQKNQFKRLLNDIGESYVVFSHSGGEGVLNFVSAGFNQVFEQPVDSVLNQPWFAKIDWLPESLEKAQHSIEQLVSGKKTSDTFTLKFTAPQSNRVKTIYVQHHGVYQDNQLISVDGLVNDITEKRESEIRLKQAATVFESANEGILITNTNNEIVRANRSIELITGYSEQELLGKNPNIFSSGLQDSAFYDTLWQTLLTTGSWQGELYNRRKNGDIYPERLKITTVLSEDQNPAYYIAILSDISFEKEHQNELEKMAHYDALTNLPNRFLLSDRISQAIHAIPRSDEMIAILFIDLDGFKTINDTHGHEAGDFLLKTIAERILDSVRDSDTVARIGGDEFVVVISSTKDQHEFSVIEQRILKETSKPILYEGQQLQLSSSIGVVYYGHNYGKNLGSEQLLRLADQTMYQAKQQGVNHIKHYEWDNIQDKTELTQALNENLFELYYQPKVNCRTGEVLSLEGLIRWNHPEKGLIPPYLFLPLIEQFGLMDKLSEFVIEDGLRYLQYINENRQQKIGISLNIQGNSLLHEGFVDKLIAKFTDNPKISPEQLTLEILESSSLDKVEQIAYQIRQLRAQGFKFAIDDFGTGHASLTYLKNLPVNEVKIDQEFIREIFNEPNSLSIIDAIKSMAEAFNISVIAEGVETEQHIELLLQLGIKAMQGYAIAKPMNCQQMDIWLKEWKINPLWQTLVEIAPQKKQLIKARLAHIAWVNKLENMVNDRLDEDFTYESALKNCEFGVWLLNKGQMILTVHDYNTINKIHQEIHQIAKQTIEAYTQKDKQHTQTFLAQLKDKSSALGKILQAIEF